MKDGVWKMVCVTDVASDKAGVCVCVKEVCV